MAISNKRLHANELSSVNYGHGSTVTYPIQITNEMNARTNA